eukprot:m.50512 g.50512  ORF g.50512 m.50512 type:complete len:384 (-) comp10675_c0_seq1:403-1554(-)
MSSKETNHYNRQNWETAEFPILCETCLGDNPYLRMTKEPYGKECKICARPFTIFRWKPGAGMRFKKTEICQTCAKMKNVCQTCLLDLEYGLPTQVRDAALGLANEIPESDVNREYYTQNMEQALENAGGTTMVGELGAVTNSNRGHDLLMKLARKQPYYKRNAPHICSFFVKGECKRGEECPYRHELPNDPNSALAKQNMVDRYHGNNDPVANKMLKRASKIPNMEPPADKSITSLYVGGVEDPFVTEQNLKDHFYQFGEIRVINILKKAKAAIVHFTERSAAEKAASASFNTLKINGRKLKLLWGRSQSQRVQGKNPNAPTFGLGKGAPGQPQSKGSYVLPPAPPGATGPPGKPLYPSQDPTRMGARTANPVKGAHQKAVET